MAVILSRRERLPCFPELGIFFRLWRRLWRHVESLRPLVRNMLWVEQVRVHRFRRCRPLFVLVRRFKAVVASRTRAQKQQHQYRLLHGTPFEACLARCAPILSALTATAICARSVASLADVRHHLGDHVVQVAGRQRELNSRSLGHGEVQQIGDQARGVLTGVRDTGRELALQLRFAPRPTLAAQSRPTLRAEGLCRVRPGSLTYCTAPSPKERSEGPARVPGDS